MSADEFVIACLPLAQYDENAKVWYPVVEVFMGGCWQGDSLYHEPFADRQDAYQRAKEYAVAEAARLQSGVRGQMQQIHDSLGERGYFIQQNGEGFRWRKEDQDGELS